MAVDSNLSSPLGPPACEKDAKALRFIEEMTRNADTVQENLLAEILARNADTEYLRRFNLCGATDRDTFKTKIPVITYEDLQPEIQRIADGDRSPILSAHPISEFLTRFVHHTLFSIFTLPITKSIKIHKPITPKNIFPALEHQPERGNLCRPLKKSSIVASFFTVSSCP